MPEHAWLTHRLDFSPAYPASSTLAQEWLLSNGTGAYSMGTPAAVNTRRYHGLFIAATHPPVGRVVTLNQVLEQVVWPGPGAAEPTTVQFTSLMFRDPQGREVLNPAGQARLTRFEKGLFARWEYVAESLRLTRELYLHWEDQAATLRYHVRVPPDRPGPARLRLWPMLTLRDFHELARKDRGTPLRTEAAGSRVTVQRGELALTLEARGDVPATWRQAGGDPWWYNVYYALDAERGQESAEDYYVPGSFELPLQAGDNTIMLSVALGPRIEDPDGWTIDDRAGRLSHLIASLHIALPDSSGAVSGGTVAGGATGGPTAQGIPSRVTAALALAADDFVVSRQGVEHRFATIIAGYPWFADWGRDTFIALPGLLLATGRHDDARSVLQVFAQNIRDGLVPNRFDDHNGAAAHYNSVDASLWFIRAALLYVEESGDRDSWDDWLGPACCRIMEAFIRGTQYGIRVSGDGLVTAGDPSTQLTWMDAAATRPGTQERVVFTPRPGKAIEINALWFYILLSVADLIKEAGEEGRRSAEHFLKLADRIRRSFAKVFWHEPSQRLIDHVWTDTGGNEHVDLALRPNQILAVSLPISPLPRTKQMQVIAALQQNLLTPAGLRTLPVDDPAYHGRYTGPPFQRDEAYHQGTIWPWLIGPMAEAVLRVGDFSLSARQDARTMIQPLLDHLMGPGLGQLAEIYEADPRPDGQHRPVGCPAQAWSVAEVLRICKLLAT